MARTPPVTDAVAVGDNVGSVASEGAVKATVFDDSCGMEPARVMNIFALTGRESEGVMVTNIEIRVEFAVSDETRWLVNSFRENQDELREIYLRSHAQ